MKTKSPFFCFLIMAAIRTGAAASYAAEDPYWPQSKYDEIQSRILDNVPQTLDGAEGYKFKTVDGTFTYSVKITDFAPRTSVEEYYEPRPGSDSSDGAADIVVKYREVEDWTWAIRAALKDAADHGGGTVVIPTRGEPYITGAIKFQGNNTRLHLEDGAILQFIRNAQYGVEGEYNDWYPQEKTRFECRDIYGFSPLIYAYKLKNIAVTGAGSGGKNAVTGDGRAADDEEDIDGNSYPDGYIEKEPGSKLSIIDGNADAYNLRIIQSGNYDVFDEDGGLLGRINRNVLLGDAENPLPIDAPNLLVPKGTPGAVAAGNWIVNLMNVWAPMDSRKIPDLAPDDPENPLPRVLRIINNYRPTFIEPYECQNVLIENFYLRRSPFWIGHPQYSQNIRVAGLHINSHGGNNDGCDPDSSQYVLIENNIFNTGDDCIAIKCGRDNDGYQDWNMPSTHFIVRDNLMRDGHGGMVAGSEMAGGVEWVFSHNNKYDSPNLYFGLRVKTNSSRGGYLRHVYMRDTEVKALMAAFMTFNFYYDNDSDTRVPAVSDIYVSNCYSPEGGFTNKPKLGLIMGKQYGSSPISGVHLKNCVFEGFHQSPASGANPNRPVTNLVCVEEGGIDYDNVRLDGELYSPPAKSVRISKLIFTNASTGEARDILTPEHIEALIKESRRGKTSWDISAVAEIKGFDYKGKHYDVSDTIDNSTYSGPLGGAARNPSVMPEKYNGGVLYVNGRSPHVKEEDKEFPHYKASGMPAYEAFVRVGTNIPVNDWTTDSETFETGPNYAVDLRAPGRVAHIGGNEYLIKLREDVAMGGTTPGRASGFNSLNKVEIVVRNALYNEDQDFVFYSALPRITGTSLDPAKRAFTVNFDRPMKGVDISPWKFSLSTGAGALIAMSGGEWSGDGASVAYTISGAVSPDGAYSFNAFDPTSQFMSYRGGVRLTGAGGEERDGGGGCDAGYAGAAFIAAAATAAFWKKAIWKKKF